MRCEGTRVDPLWLRVHDVTECAPACPETHFMLKYEDIMSGFDVDPYSAQGTFRAGIVWKLISATKKKPLNQLEMQSLPIITFRNGLMDGPKEGTSFQLHIILL